MSKYQKPTSKVYKRYQDRNSSTTPLKEAIDQLLKSYRIDAKFSHERIKLHWEEIMGKPVSSRTEQLFVKDSKLFVRVNSAPLRQDLNMQQELVLKRIHEFAGTKAIKAVLFI